MHSTTGSETEGAALQCLARTTAIEAWKKTKGKGGLFFSK
jgi:hypothetical protein